uniref:Uncharacterized protein n=1 Tax=Arundo donax TaxID=35708 RepID=A0A0A8YGK6_ARUDO
MVSCSWLCNIRNYYLPTSCVNQAAAKKYWCSGAFHMFKSDHIFCIFVCINSSSIHRYHIPHRPSSAGSDVSEPNNLSAIGWSGSKASPEASLKRR